MPHWRGKGKERNKIFIVRSDGENGLPASLVLHAFIYFSSDLEKHCTGGNYSLIRKEQVVSLTFSLDSRRTQKIPFVFIVLNGS
jgi:hypothetical protein